MPGLCIGVGLPGTEVPRGAVWQPSDLSNLHLHYNRDTFVTSGVDITSWPDAAGSNDADQATADKSPHETADVFGTGWPAATPDATDDQLDLTTALSISAPATFAEIIKAPTTPGGNTVSFGSGTGFEFIKYDGAVKFKAGNTETILTTAGAISGSTVYRIIIFWKTGGNLKVYIDGSDATNGTPNNTNTFAASTLFTRTSTAYSDLETGEHIIWTADHEASVADIDAYLTA